MCVNPVPIPNPLFGHADFERGVYWTTEDGEPVWHELTPEALATHDFTSRVIEVDCRKCAECLTARQNNYVFRAVMASVGCWVYFFTLTYDDRMMPVVNIGDRKVRYADFDDVRQMVRRVRQRGFKFEYLVVSEYSRRGRPHFHGLLFVPKPDVSPELESIEQYRLERQLWAAVLDCWARNYGSRKCPEYYPLCRYVVSRSYGKQRSTYDLHFVVDRPDNPGEAVSRYITKYILKPSAFEIHRNAYLKYHYPDEYKSHERILRSRVVYSPRFTSSSSDAFASEISKCVDAAVPISYPVPSLSKRFPISRYLVSRYITEAADVRRKASACDGYGCYAVPVQQVDSNRRGRAERKMAKWKLSIKDYSPQFVDLEF